MEKFIAYAKKIDSILMKARDENDRIDLTKLSKKDLVRLKQAHCNAFSYLSNSNLLIQLFQDTHNIFETHLSQYTELEYRTVLKFFKTFLAFEEQAFEMKGLSPKFARETFESAGDIKEEMEKFIFEPKYRQELLNLDNFKYELEKVRNNVCKGANTEANEMTIETRHIIGGIAASLINTGLDIGTGAIAIFTVLSTGAGGIIAWKRLRW